MAHNNNNNERAKKMSEKISKQDLIALSNQGKLWGSVFATVGGYPGKGYQGHGRGLPATVTDEGEHLVIECGAMSLAIYNDRPVYRQGDDIWWGSALTLVVSDEPPPEYWEAM